ncbi:unnamed protein product [Caenorhabditis auriculariae]|uniref:Uncharacterized protein n=1 Tax=Caenorhabditis auriculariae TaxID=2777116 RepID=A0A8S1GQF2_9PELO|nr:unnamed protein product [Caenorhabditis auriculariae]
MLVRIVLLIAVVVGNVFCQALRSQDAYLTDEVEAPLTAMKRFYSWEDGRRADDDGSRLKRKQFYAWAGKRSAPEDDVLSSSGQINKRKQFYAWAGR